jgi:hypothetical protein
MQGRRGIIVNREPMPALGPAASPNGSGGAQPLHAWPLPSTSHSETRLCVATALVVGHAHRMALAAPHLRCLPGLAAVAAW